MQQPRYYRSQAELAQRLATAIDDEEAAASLLRMAQDYEDIAEDLENGAIEIRHSERMPQLKRKR